MLLCCDRFIFAILSPYALFFISSDFILDVDIIAGVIDIVKTKLQMPTFCCLPLHRVSCFLQKQVVELLVIKVIKQVMTS